MASFDQPAVRFLVPGDPGQKTGGYRYVGQLVNALNQMGVQTDVRGLEGSFPIPDATARAAMDSALSDSPDDALVVLDGLAMGGLPQLVEKHSRRLRLWSLVHHPLADETGLSPQNVDFLFKAESRALASVEGILVTSQHTANRLQAFWVPAEKVHVVEPGADTVKCDGGLGAERQCASTPQLLCVASLSPRKAQHQLVDALSQLQHLPWHCTLVGSVDREPDYAEQVRQRINALDLADRFSLLGELDDQALAQQYGRADCFVLPSLYEGYGMVIDEALVAGLPVISSDGGALATTGDRPGVLLYRAGSVAEMQVHLETCLASEEALDTLKTAAKHSAKTVRLWSQAALECAGALGFVASQKDHSQFDLDWLTLREPADRRARNRQLLSEVQQWLGRQDSVKPLQIVDLGAGAGSNGVFFRDAFRTPQHWSLLDQDESLLDRAKTRLLGDQMSVSCVPCRMVEGNLDACIPADADLITAAALIDLVSEPWLQALATVASARRAGVYVVISYAGDFRLWPDHPDDQLVRSLVNQHQHGNKGGGSALGPDATGRLKAAMEAHGYEVSVGPSPWELGKEDGDLQQALVRGWSDAALEQSPTDASRIQSWRSLRLTQAAQSELVIRVDHDDLFASPPHD